jgi:hypothetical protein
VNKEELEAGQVLISEVKVINGGKVSLTVIEAKERGSGTNLLAAFNKSDDRFQGASLVYGWLNAEPADLKRLLGVDVKALKLKKVGDSAELGLLNPVATIGEKEVSLRVELKETEFPQDDYQSENQEETCKQYTDDDGDTQYLLSESGNHIWRRTEVVGRVPNDVRVQHAMETTEFTESVAEAVADTLELAE